MKPHEEKDYYQVECPECYAMVDVPREWIADGVAYVQCLECDAEIEVEDVENE